MMMRRVYGFIPTPVFYSDKMPEGVGGFAVGPAIWIRPKYAGDEGLHRHELEHVRQAWTLLLVIHALLYLFVRPYRLWAEARAYRIQMRYPDAVGGRLTLQNAAFRLMAPRYRLNLTLAKALEVLR